MSLTYTQLLREIEKNCGFEVGGISGNTQRKSDFTDDINTALTDAMAEIFSVGGTWQFDDSNHTKYPIIKTDIVSGQRDYSFATDEQGNLVLDIFKVVVTGSDGVKREIDPVDVMTPKADVSSFIDGAETGGQPTRYDKLGNGIFLDPVPNYNADEGLEIYINREGSFFTTSDTTKKAGIDGRLHEYLALVPSYKYARNKSLGNVARLEKDIESMRLKIRDVYGKREKDIIRTIKPLVENNK